MDEAKHAMDIGCSAGQIAIASYILKTYPNAMDLELKLFLERVLEREYIAAGDKMDKPGEDIALAVEQMYARK